MKWEKMGIHSDLVNDIVNCHKHSKYDVSKWLLKHRLWLFKIFVLPYHLTQNKESVLTFQYNFIIIVEV